MGCEVGRTKANALTEVTKSAFFEKIAKKKKKIDFCTTCQLFIVHLQTEDVKKEFSLKKWHLIQNNTYE